MLFNGPHGKSILMDVCKNILMVATGFGIAVHLPYLKQIIYDYNACEVRARRIHLVLQVRDIGKPWPLSFSFKAETWQSQTSQSRPNGSLTVH